MGNPLAKEHVWVSIVMGVLNVLDEGREYPTIWDLQMCAWITKLGTKATFVKLHVWRTPNILNKLKCEFKVNIAKEWKIRVHFLVRGTSKVEGRARASG
jgi:hypothetical protein